jgi:15-cis-phytoene synthase
MTPDAYCQDKAAPAGSTLYYSLLYLPETQRGAVTALYAFQREADQISRECRDADVARIKLQWWRDEVRRLFDNEPRHPVTKALREPIRAFNLPREHFLEVIDGVDMDISTFSYTSVKDLMRYCHRVSSMIAMMAAEICGYGDRGTLKYAHALGSAAKLTEIIFSVREDAVRGRIYVPMEELQRFQVLPEDLATARPTDNVRQLIKFQVRRARDHFRDALELLPAADRYAQRGGIIMAAIQQAAFKGIEKQGYPVPGGIMLTPLRKLWIAWKTAHRERRHARPRPSRIRL